MCYFNDKLWFAYWLRSYDTHLGDCAYSYKSTLRRRVILVRSLRVITLWWFFQEKYNPEYTDWIFPAVLLSFTVGSGEHIPHILMTFHVQRNANISNVSIFVYVHMHPFIFQCVYLYMYISMYVSMYVCMYVCMDGWMDGRVYVFISCKFELQLPVMEYK